MSTQACDTEFDATQKTNPAVHAALPELSPGSTVGRYLVIGEVGVGGMGRVLRAYDPKLEREVALKLLRTDVLDSAAQARLLREARAMAQLSHPNVVAVYDVDSTQAAGVVLAMEFVDGSDLRRWMRAQSRAWTAIISHFVDAARGLSAAHNVGLLHRDFKPSNILLGEDGRVRVTDFGLARVAEMPASVGDDTGPGQAWHDAQVDVTKAGVVVGTPAYMSPEQHTKAELTEASDQYSLCVSLWEALVGTRPFAHSGMALFDEKMKGPPPWPTSARVPNVVADAVRRGLAVNPKHRHASIDALIAALTRDPNRRRNTSVLVGVVGGVGLGVWGTDRWLAARTAQRCDDESKRIASTWNDEVAATIQAQLATTDISYAGETWLRARHSLDQWAAGWTTVAQSVCDPASTTSAASRDASRQCLEERRAHLAGLLAQLEHPARATVARIGGAVARLPRADRCTDERWLGNRMRNPPGAQYQGVGALRIRLSEVGALADAGQFDEALSVAEQLHRDADAEGWLPLRAQTSYQLAVVHAKMAQPEQAVRRYQDALYLATSSGQDDIALQAASNLAFTEGYVLAKLDAGERWLRFGEALVDRLDIPEHPLAASLLVHGATLAGQRGNDLEALADYRAGLEIWEREVGENHPRLASIHSAIGALLSTRGEHADALQSFHRALQVRQAVFGPEHPAVADAWHNLGSAQFHAAQFDDALVSFEAALAIRRSALRPGHPDLAASLNNIANVYAKREEYARATSLYAEALARHRVALGNDHPEVGMTLSNLAIAQAGSGDATAAVVSCDEALEILETASVPPQSLAMTQAAMADVLWQVGQRARAVDLARASRTTFESLGHDTARKLLEDTDQWLAEHDVDTPAVDLPHG